MFKMLKVRKKKKELYNVSKENNTSRLCFFAKKVKGGGGWGKIVKEWKRGRWEICHQKSLCERTTVKLKRMQWEAQLEE